MKLPKQFLELIWLGVFTLAYFLLASFSGLLISETNRSSAIWPAAGLALAILLKYGYRTWPAIFLGTFLYLFHTKLSVSLILINSASNTFAALTTAWLVKRYTVINHRFKRSEDVFKFVICSSVGAAISALIGTIVLVSGGLLTTQVYWQAWFIWFIGDLCGMVLFTPLILSWRSSPSLQWNRWKIIEITLFALVFLACNLFIFSMRGVSLLFLIFPCMVWLAFRFTQSEINKASVILVFIAIISVLHDTGPLVGSPVNPFLLLQVFTIVIGVGSLMLSVAVDERSEALRALKRIQDVLEARVLQRTAQLKQTIATLRKDILERKKTEQKIHHLAHHDPLTGLANRMLFRERLEHAIAQSNRSGEPIAILFIDLDHFKVINDTAGHSAGDKVLRECAQRLQQCLRISDTVARTGGDEFLVLMESSVDLEHTPSVAKKILHALERPFYIDQKEYAIGASIGISTYPTDGAYVDMLIRNADIAMYRAKAEGRGRYRYYSAAMAEQNLERYAMKAALRHALERGEMELYYQPKVHLKNGQISGAEALIRWRHPEQGLLLPQHFIPLAEDMGIIAEIGLWTIGEVCRQSKVWQQQGLPPIRIAVNLAYAQFADEDFSDKVRDLLHEAGLESDHLELELTETMVMENAERLMGSLQQLKQLGVHLSIDDFGTGYSSLTYLKRLPVDSVKLDGSFIKDLPHDLEDVAITQAVLALVHSLKRSVVAECIETQEQLAFLIQHGCEEGQGYYFSPALPADAFRRFLVEHKVFAI